MLRFILIVLCFATKCKCEDDAVDCCEGVHRHLKGGRGGGSRGGSRGGGRSYRNRGYTGHGGYGSPTEDWIPFIVIMSIIGVTLLGWLCYCVCES